MNDIMRRFVILTALVLSCIGMMAQEKTVIKGVFDKEYAPEKVTFFYRDGESVSVPVVNGHFSVELPTDITKSYDVSMGRNVEVTIVPEGGTLTIRRRPDGRCAVGSDKVNSLNVRLDSLTSFRRRNYKDSTLMVNEYKRVISANRDNAVGYMALFFLTNFGNTDAKTRFELANTLSANMLAEPRTAKLKKAIEAVYNTSVGMKFQDFEGVDIVGGTVRLSDYAGKGKYILLDFWSTSCGPCRRAFPHIRDLYEKLGGDRFDVVGVPVWEKVGLSKETIKENNLTWRNILGTEESAADLYGVTFVPTYLLIAPDGTIIVRGDLSEIEPIIRKLAG